LTDWKEKGTSTESEDTLIFTARGKEIHFDTSEELFKVYSNNKEKLCI
jgi:hypothetical protein